MVSRPEKDHPRSWARARPEWMVQAREVLRRRPVGRRGHVAAHDSSPLGLDAPEANPTQRCGVVTAKASHRPWNGSVHSERLILVV